MASVHFESSALFYALFAGCPAVLHDSRPITVPGGQIRTVLPAQVRLFIHPSLKTLANQGIICQSIVLSKRQNRPVKKEADVRTTFPVRVKDKVFHPGKAARDDSAFYRALKAAKECREREGTAASYQTLCLCRGSGVELVIRRSRRKNRLYLAAWPNTRGQHARQCRFRVSGAVYGAGIENKVTKEEAEPVHFHFEKPANESALPGHAFFRKKKDSLLDVLHRIWKEAALTARQHDSPKDWFDAVNRIVPAVRNIRFAGGLPLEGSLKIWAPAHHGNAARFNESADVRGDFLVIGEAYSLARFKGLLPFCHFPRDCMVRLESSRLFLATRGFSAQLRRAFSSRSRRVIGLAHVRNSGQSLEAIELVLMIVDESYIPAVVKPKPASGS